MGGARVRFPGVSSVQKWRQRAGLPVPGSPLRRADGAIGTLGRQEMARPEVPLVPSARPGGGHAASCTPACLTFNWRGHPVERAWRSTAAATEASLG